MEETRVHVGFDDTDSPFGLCTTYLATLILTELHRGGFHFADFPYLIRLNPNIPFKTRGNGAVSIHLENVNDIEALKDTIQHYLEKYALNHPKTDPTAVIYTGPLEQLKVLYHRALSDLVSPSLVKKLLDKNGGIILGGNKGRGIVGAAASIGAYKLEKYTYELLLYRSPDIKKRNPSIEEIILEIDKILRPLIFSNVDYRSGRILAVPHGPDPVAAGIRSLNPLVLTSISNRLAKLLECKQAVIYKTNQATNCHLNVVKSIADLRPYDAAIVRGVVAGKVQKLKGGHVIFKITHNNSQATCAVFRETGILSRVAYCLREGDEVEVGGGVQPRTKGLTINAEYIRVLSVKSATIIENPTCPKCGKRMESAGRGKGYRCKRCNYTDIHTTKIVKEVPRPLEPGLYLQSPSAYRHLSLPKEIIGSKPIPAKPFPEFFLCLMQP
ncbi:MAG: tRNA(Ile)(2)-agmatinylcytidine synthase [Thermofilaceae archaeon]|nr:tRNA(Ile)(2)-agmatinylcytidine synthase [Thermofilaceae archaeon]MDW8003821.1 tRNA(Ile)(2)-agmatinylcytidine synthase [Thermofilaceae archaeon]